MLLFCIEHIEHVGTINDVFPKRAKIRLRKMRLLLQPLLWRRHFLFQILLKSEGAVAFARRVRSGVNSALFAAINRPHAQELSHLYSQQTDCGRMYRKHHRCNSNWHSSRCFNLSTGVSPQLTPASYCTARRHSSLGNNAIGKQPERKSVPDNIHRLTFMNDSNHQYNFHLSIISG